VTAPSERIRMGFIGQGGQGSGHLFGGAWTYVPGGYMARDDVQVLAVCDVQKARRDRSQARVNKLYGEKFGKTNYRGCDAYNDFRELLARPDIDAVLFALPIQWHALMATMALKAGKDVYSEKPGCMTVRWGRAVVETAKRYGRVYQVGTQQRSEYGGKFRWAVELVRNGRIGELKEIYTFREPGGYSTQGWTTTETRPIPEGFDWDLCLGPAPWRPFLGNAATFFFMFGDVNWSPHHYDIVQWGLDADRSGPAEVWLENGIVQYRYPNGVLVHGTAYPGETIGPVGGVCFVGTEGRIAVDRVGIVSHPASILKQPLRPDDKRVYQSHSHSGNFLKCIRTRRQTICVPETMVRSMTVILIGGIAMTLKRPLKWDPVKEEFPGDDEANRLLSAAMRPPWHL
jgi:Oxidoreductase family, NAD-binding Rossmann fold/Oxidoreductase family, C-terminal alpha/beta domain